MTKISNTSYLKFIKSIGISAFLQELPNNYYKKNQNKNLDLNSYKINQIKNLNELESFIKNSGYHNLKKYNNKTVIKDGYKESNIMLIGDMPSKEDENIGKPFQGNEGKLLNKMLNAINLKREKLYITNVFPWRPFEKSNITNDELLKLLPYIQKQIEIVKPKLILLLGSIATKAILNSNINFSDLRGKWHKFQSINLDNSIECLASYHPNYLLNQPEYKKYSWEDLKLFQKKIIDEKI